MRKKYYLKIKECKKLTEITLEKFLYSALPRWDRLSRIAFGPTQIYQVDENGNYIPLEFDNPPHLFKYLLTEHGAELPKEIKEKWNMYVKSPKHQGETLDEKIRGFLKAFPDFNNFLASSCKEQAISKEDYEQARLELDKEKPKTSTTYDIIDRAGAKKKINNLLRYLR